jgi:voltage-gated potassium channel
MRRSNTAVVMSLIVIERPRRASSRPGYDPTVSAVSLPSRRFSPLTAVVSRASLAVALLGLTTVIVYLDRTGYTDAATPGQPVNLLASAYYSVVTLTTTGYGDIVPVSAAARLVNILVVTPIRVLFLILLIGTTFEVLAGRTRLAWRISRWRSRLSGHTVVVGYGTKGRSALATLRDAGLPTDQAVVVDISPHVIAEVNREGIAAVSGDAARRQVLARAEIRNAAKLVIAVGRDDTAVLISLTARQLNPEITIVAAVRDAENEPLLRQSGADQVVVSSDAAGRLLGLSTLNPAVGQVFAQLLDQGRGLSLSSRPAESAEIGMPVLLAAAGAVAVVRGDRVFATDDPAARQLREGDRIVLVTAADQSPMRR